GAARAFSDAEDRARAAEAWLSAPWVRVAGFIPVLGRVPDVGAAVARAAVLTARAANGVAGLLAQLPDGPASLLPERGRIPVERIAPLAPALASADALVERALAEVRTSPATLLPTPVAAARRRSEEELADLHRGTHAAALILDRLPGFLGADGPRRYLLFAENPAELRGTGGILGAWAPVALRDGRVRIGRFRPLQAFPKLDPDDVPPPNPDYARLYDPLRRDGLFWTAINVTPDFPSAARAILNGYRAIGGPPVQGVLTADVFALQALVRLTGPARVPAIDRSLGAGEVVAFVANEAYAEFPGAARRKRLLGDVAGAVLDRFLRHPPRDPSALRTLLHVAAEGHVEVFSTDPVMEEGLAATGVGGALRGGPGDLLGIFTSSGSGSKVDYYQERRVTYEIRLGADGASRTLVRLDLTNHAPSSGAPRYVIGPSVPGREPGESVPLVNLYCAPGCRLVRAARDGRPVGLWADRELGLRLFQDSFSIPSGGHRTLQVELWRPGAWTGNSSGGTYRLTVLSQRPIRPASLRIVVHPPEGMHVTATEPPMRVEGGVAIWEGIPSRRLELEASFAPPLATRLWRDVVRFLSRPAIRF
ncbi:MAG TPA: DUF4012 domain-containing protein, partial [Actinomycetota bacterium]|nr:DUF4012 domain-containing protein [Actinomycetota bacterium]